MRKKLLISFLILLFFATTYSIYKLPYLVLEAPTNLSDDNSNQAIIRYLHKIEHYKLPKPTGEIFNCKTNNEFLLFSMITHRNSFGITKPLTNTIYIAPSNINTNTTYTRQGRKRKYTSVLYHELTHLSLNKKYGLIKALTTPKWKIEGICELIANDSSYDINKGLTLIKDKIPNKSNSFKYFTYRIAIDYLVNQRGVTIDEIMDRDYNFNTVMLKLRSQLLNGNYKPFIN